jgi:transcriptional regulator with XRE-family HTH domain
VYELGELLKRLRGKLSLREAAKRSGLSYSYISSLEKGKHPRTGAPINPTPDILRSLAKAYNYPHEELMMLAGHLDKETKDDIHKEETEADAKRKKGNPLLENIKEDKLDHTLFLLEQLNKE